MTRLIVPENPDTHCKSKSVRDISTLMENDLFRDFFNNHLQNWQDIETSIMLMKVYEAFETSIVPLIGPITNKEKQRILACMTEKAIHDKDFRMDICKHMQNFIKGRNDVKFLDVKTFIMDTP